MAGPLVDYGLLPFGADDLDLTILRASLQFSARDMQEISPLPDAGSDLAIAPAERLAPARPSAGSGKWTAAIAISCVLHAAVAAAFLISHAGKSDSQDTMESQGSDQTGDKVAGSALDKNPQAVNVTLVPNPQPAKPKPAKAARPVPPTKPSRPEQEAVAPVPEPAPEQQAQSSSELIKQSVVTPDILVAATPRPDRQSVAARNAITNTETPAQPAPKHEAVEMPVAVPDQPPIPQARPAPAAAPVREAGGRSGTADGQDRLAQAASKGKQQKEAGTSAEDSYRGDVFAKLGSVNRTLPPSLQLAARNNAVVAFVVGRKGNIDELRILESSGSAVFDKAALGIVRKAAPFPPMPPQAASPSLEFEIGIGPF
ncbi:energy transducer TonB [Mesorhizobium sp. RCC_202]|uniref:energy transducer TonB n=1 Tax=Mesorhizobium sp. RCC_202 TaxID=3239222 RepID=UPI003524F8B8